MDALDLLRILEVILGIGLVIFVHELGHFLAARWCGVRVEIFSLGFGPPLWSLRRGDTRYQLALVPFGGFVKMAGEGAPADSSAPHDELSSKSVGQRFFVYSGGILMNLVFALLAFPLALSAGVPVTPARVGPPIPGGPAWRAGISAGSEILSVDGEPIFDMEALVGAVALAPEEIEVQWRSPEGALQHARLRPEPDERLGFRRIGVSVGIDAEGHLHPSPPGQEPRIQPGDRLLRIPSAPPGLAPQEALDWASASGSPFEVELLDADGMSRIVQFEPRWQELSGRLFFGLAPAGLFVKSLRAAAEQLGLQAGDRLIAVGEAPLVGVADWLPALQEAAPVSELLIEREGRALSLALPDTPAERARLWQDLALVAREEAPAVWLDPRGAALQAGLPQGSTILAVAGAETADFRAIQAACAEAAESGQATEFRYLAPGSAEPRTLLISPGPARASFAGLSFVAPKAVFRTEGLLASFREGARASWRFLVDTAMTLRRMATRDVSAKNLGGIITISRVSYEVSSLGWTKLLFFLCILSVNLAFLNVLPIPILDGGHLFFLLMEGLRGSPVSVRTMNYSQLVGLVLVVTLMVYVTYNDLMRLLMP